MKKIFYNPYIYIFAAAYYGVWLLWNQIHIPFRNPYHVVGALSVANYNPSNNILRFLLLLFLPPLLCFLYWICNHSFGWIKHAVGEKALRIVVAIMLCAGCLAVLLGAAVAQSSTSGTNDPSTYGGPYKYTIVDTFHEGETLGSATEYAQKDLKPYKNIVFVHGVLQDPVRSLLAFKIFGRSIGAERTLSSIITIITYLLSFLMLLVLFRGSLLKASMVTLLMGLCFMPTQLLPGLATYFVGYQLPSLDFQTIFFLIFSIFAIRSAMAERARLTAVWSALSGFVIVAGFANAVDRALFIVALAAIWLVMLAMILGWRRLLRQILAPMVLGGLVGFVVLGIALKGDYRDLVVFLLHISQYKEFMDGLIFTRPDKATSLALIGLAIAVTWAASRLIVACEASTESRLASKLTDWRKAATGLVQQHYVFILLLATAIIFLRSAVGRADIGHFSYSLYWTYLFFAYLATQFLFSHRLGIRRLLYFLTVVMLLFSGVYYAHVVRSTNLAANTFPVHVPDAALIPPDYQQTAAFLRQNLHGQDSFVTLTSEGFWYYAVNKPSPVKYYIVWFAATDKQRQDLAHTIATNEHIKYIVTNTNWTSDIDFVPNEQRLPEVYAVLHQDYQPFVGFGRQTIWQRIK